MAEPIDPKRDPRKGPTPLQPEPINPEPPNMPVDPKPGGRKDGTHDPREPRKL